MAKLRAAPGIFDLIDEITENGEKVVIFSFYKNVLEMIQERYKDRCVLINGSVDSSKRRDLVKKFSEEESCDIFIGQTDAAGESIDLTAAAYVIVCDLPFTPPQLDQAIDRLHRGRQTRPVTAYLCMAEESIDDMLFDLIANKSQDINDAIDRDKPTLNYSNIGEDLFNKLISNYKKEAVTHDE